MCKPSYCPGHRVRSSFPSLYGCIWCTVYDGRVSGLMPSKTTDGSTWSTEPIYGAFALPSMLPARTAAVLKGNGALLVRW